MSTPFTWSYSRLKNYETCPKRHYHYDIAKDVSDATKQNTEGQDAHKAFELRLKRGVALPLPYAHHEPILAKLAGMGGITYPEQKLALTDKFKPTAFFAKNVWFRTVMDFCNINGTQAIVLDYKMGKPTSDMTQLQLMSATVMHYQPEIVKVKAGLLFLNHGIAERAEFQRGNLPQIWGGVLPRVRKLETAMRDQEYPPKPNGLCVRYCHVVSCPFHGRGSRA